MTPAKHATFALFRDGCTIEDAMHQTKLARSTIADHLADFVRVEQPKSIASWVPEAEFKRIAAAAKEHGTERLKPVYLALNEQVSYDAIRIAFAFLESGKTENTN